MCFSYPSSVSYLLDNISSKSRQLNNKLKKTEENKESKENLLNLRYEQIHDLRDETDIKYRELKN